MTLDEKLDHAADLIEAGWARGTFVDSWSTGAVEYCVVGAVRKAITGDPHYEGLFTDYGVEIREALKSVRAAMPWRHRHLVSLGLYSLHSDVMRWNDNRANQALVVRVLRKAAKRERRARLKAERCADRAPFAFKLSDQVMDTAPEPVVSGFASFTVLREPVKDLTTVDEPMVVEVVEERPVELVGA